MAESSDLPAAASPSPRRSEPETVTLSMSDARQGTVPEPQPRPVAGEGSEAVGRPFGDYELLGEIERGGQGIVYRARERSSGRLVALKMMLSESATGPADLQRFILEAKATSEIDHPGVVTIHAWGEHEGHPFYTMDFVPGQSLNRLLEKGPLSCDRAVRYLTGIARAVAAAHAMGIVHRDLKPGNVMIDSSEQPRVLDFGLAKRQRSAPVRAKQPEEIVDALPADAPIPTPGDSAPQARLTAKGAIVGTPSYMAPEQVRAQQEQVGPRSDVYALGAIFYEMLTGHPPFQGNSTIDTLQQVVQRRPKPIRALNPRVPASLEALCEHCLEKEPHFRHANAGALADDLESRWLQITRTRHFARLTAVAGLVILMLQLVQIVLTRAFHVNGSTLAGLAGDLAGGGLFGVIADILVRLGWGLGFVLVPVLAEVGLGIWLGQWIWHTSRPALISLLWALAAVVVLTVWIVAGAPFLGEVLLFFPLLLVVNAFIAGIVAVARWGSGHVARQSDPHPSGAEPFLQRLFAVRVEPRSRSKAPPEPEGAVGLGDFELGKTLHTGEACTVRRARQKSLDRAVLMWMDHTPASAGAPLPGVVVRHPGVLALHAVGWGPEGWCLVTAPLAATPLEDLIQRRGIQPGEAVELAARLAHVLQAFHEQGVCHGRLGPEWILVHGDLEPVLCPCGLPSQSSADHARDLTALGRLLQEWLPPPPRAWQRRWLAPVYRVCAAAAQGVYTRAVHLATDLERAAQLARIRWRQGWVTALVVALVLLPLLALLVDPGERGPAYLLLAICPGALVLGYGHGRALVNRHRLRVRDTARNQMMKGSLVGILLPIGLVLAPASMLTWVGLPEAVGVAPVMRAVLLAGGFWLMGAVLAGLVTFGEFLLSTLKRH